MRLTIKYKAGKIETFDNVDSVRFAESFYKLNYLVILRGVKTKFPKYKAIDRDFISWIKVDREDL